MQTERRKKDAVKTIALVGYTNTGKSTLLNVISGIDTYEEGEILIENKKSVIFNYTDANTGYNTMCFEMRMCDQCTPNGNVFSSNECVHIHLTESVETMLLLDSISEKGGNLKIKANLTADVSFKCKMSLDLAVVPRYDA